MTRENFPTLELYLEAIESELAGTRRMVNAAYTERNRVVALLARLYPSGLRATAINGWDTSWHGCVYIETPHGQLSWHFHESDGYLFDGLPPYEPAWDEHTTTEKYDRIRGLCKALDTEGTRVPADSSGKIGEPVPADTPLWMAQMASEVARDHTVGPTLRASLARAVIVAMKESAREVALMFAASVEKAKELEDKPAAWGVFHADGSAHIYQQKEAADVFGESVPLMRAKK